MPSSAAGDMVRGVFEGQSEEVAADMIDDTAGEQDTAQADHVHLRFDPHEVLGAVVGHRRRYANTVAALAHDELARPSRCEGWSVADVLRHGIWVDEAMQRIWSGGMFPEGFDPRTTPNEFVASHRDVPDREIQRRYLATTDAMILKLESADTDMYSNASVSPLGQVPWWFTVVHLGWDSSVHERDALLPLGHDVEQIPGETTLFLAYSLVLASFFAGPDPLTVQVNTVRLHRGNGPVITWANTMDDRSEEAGGSHFDEHVTELTGIPAPTIDALTGRGHLTDVLEGPKSTVDRLRGFARFFNPST
jgi:uncharacterized protein (TIGR03083 family)